MIVYKDTEYDSKAAVVRAMYLAGDVDNSPEQKKRVALLLSMTVQTVHATIAKMLSKDNPTPKTKEVPVQQLMPKILDNYADVRNAIIHQYDECYEIAKRKGYDLPKIEILWDLKGTCAGQFCRRPEKHFRVNMELARQNIKDYLADTVPHEFSHYIARYKYLFCKPHGDEWKQIMRTVFDLVPRRCHEYDVSEVCRKRGPTYQYACGCLKPWHLSRIRHLRVLTGRHYTCPKCHQRLLQVSTIRT